MNLGGVCAQSFFFWSKDSLILFSFVLKRRYVQRRYETYKVLKSQNSFVIRREVFLFLLGSLSPSAFFLFSRFCFFCFFVFLRVSQTKARNIYNFGERYKVTLVTYLLLVLFNFRNDLDNNSLPLSSPCSDNGLEHRSDPTLAGAETHPFHRFHNTPPFVWE